MQNAFLKRTCYEYSRTAGKRDSELAAEKCRAKQEIERAKKIEKDCEKKLKEARQEYLEI